MADTVILASYTIRLIDKRTNDYAYLDGTHGGLDILHVLERFLDSVKTDYFHQRDSKQIFKVIDLNKDAKSLYGVISCGKYGMSSDIVDTDTMSSAYSRKAKDALALPFYFLIYVTPNSRRAVLILQRIGNQGVFTVMTSAFRLFLRNFFSEYVLETKPHVPKQVLNYLSDGRIKSVTLTSHKIPRDFTDRVGLEGNEPKSIVFTQTLTVKGKNDILTIPGLSNALKKTRQILEGEAASTDEVDQVKVNVSYNGRQRTVSFADPSSIAPYVDVSDDVTVTPNGHPDPDEMYLVALVLAEDVSKEIRQ